MHMYAKYDTNILCGSRGRAFSLTANDERTHMVVIVQTQGSCNACTN